MKQRYDVTERFVKLHIKQDGLYFDLRERGFGVRRQNGIVTFFLNYTFNGRERRATLGEPSRRRWPQFKVAEALAAAKQMKAELSGDQLTKPTDPLAARTAARAALTIRQLADRFRVEHLEVHRRPNYVRSVRNIINAVIVPKLGTHRLTAVSREDIEEVHRSLRKTPYYANRVVGILSSMFGWAKDHQLMAANPTNGVHHFDEDEREAFLTPAQMKSLEAALSLYADQRLADGIRLLIYTGCRHVEVLQATWSQFRLDGAKPLWTLPAHATKQKKPNHIRLNTHALDAVLRLKKTSSSEYLFPGNTDDGRRQSFRTPWRDIRKAAGLPTTMHLHDLRHAYASALVSEGVPLFTVGKLLGHSRLESTHRYSHLVPEALDEATSTADLVFERALATPTVQ